MERDRELGQRLGYGHGHAVVGEVVDAREGTRGVVGVGEELLAPHARRVGADRGLARHRAAVDTREGTEECARIGEAIFITGVYTVYDCELPGTVRYCGADVA